MSKKIFRESGISFVLIPEKIIFLLCLFSLGIPNLIFSGRNFADLLHIMKWTAVFLPFFILLLIAGIRLYFYGKEIKIDIFASFLGLIILYCAGQFFFPFVVKISSVSGFFQELFCLISVWLFYVFIFNYFPERGLNSVLWIANINAAINVFFAELQTRGLYDLAFLKDTKLEFLIPLKNLIWTGFLGEDINYMGNVGQHNMLGLWLAICAVSAAYLFLINIKKQKFFASLTALFFMSVNILGLLSGNSRSGLFSMISGLFALGLIFILRSGRIYKKYIAVIVVIFIAALSGLIFTNSQGINRMIEKIKSPEQFTTIAGRTGLWARSFDMLKLYPNGVGIGQYKWHFLEAQRERFKADKTEKFRYTLWAHNEFIQFFCEAGITGGVMLIFLLVFWFYKFIKILISKREIANSLIWSVSIIFVFLFNALWTRPFHRPELLIWLMFAFAAGNREIFKNFSIKATKPLGLIFVFISLSGILYLSGGLYGNFLLQRAVKTQNDAEKVRLLSIASKFPVVNEKALRELAIFYLDLGEKIRDLDVCERAFRLLYDSFCREPDPNLLTKILIWAQHFQDEKIIREIVSYHKPGTYIIENVEAKDSQGNSTDVIMVRNMSDSDDE